MNEVLAYFGYAFLLINIILYFKGFFIHEKAFKVLCFYFLIVFIIQIFVGIMKYFKINNLFLSHVYFDFQFIILSVFYYLINQNDIQKRFIKISILLCFIILSLQLILDNDLFFKFNLFEIFITSFLLIVFSVFHLYNMLNIEKKYYYINIGILIYLFGSTVLFLSGNIVAKLKPEYNDIPWILNSLLYIVYQLFILYEWKVSFSNNKKKLS